MIIRSGGSLVLKKWSMEREKSGSYDPVTQTNAPLASIANKINDRCEIIGDFGFWQNSGVVDLSTRVTGYHDIWPVDINNSGAVLATAVDDDVGNNHNVLLLPVELVPDWNHDGKIDAKDHGRLQLTIRTVFGSMMITIQEIPVVTAFQSIQAME